MGKFTKKPFYLKLFATLLIAEPLIKIGILSINSGFPVDKVLQRSLDTTHLSYFFNFWLLFPLSGLLILRVRKYTYVAFMLLQTYNIIFHLTYKSYEWPYLSESPHISSMILLYLNIIIMVILLLPEIREPFFNARKRWWESAARFLVELPCFLLFKDNSVNSTIVDISISGALLEPGKTLGAEINDIITFKFTIFNSDYELQAQVLRFLDDGRMAVKTIYPNQLEKLKLRLHLLWVRSRALYPQTR